MQEIKNPKEIRKSKFSYNWKNAIKRKIPIVFWLPDYNVRYLLHDLLAGFTVALTEIPQSIAYAGIAGLPLQYGLYSSFMGGFIYAIFGSCKAINMGSTSIMALLIQSYVQELGVGASIFMSLIGGVIVLIFGILNLGFVIEFFSYPVMSGFTSAAALTIASSQIKNFLGIKGQAVGFLQSWQDVAQQIKEINKWDTVLGITTLIILLGLKELGNFCVINHHEKSKKIILFKKLIFLASVAKNAIVVSLGMTVAYCLETKNLNYLTLTGCVDGGFPYFKLPDMTNFWSYCQNFGLSLIFIPLVAILETIAIAKVFSKGKSLDGSQEMIALGIANIMGSFVQSMPVTGSFTRTAVNNASGAKSNMAAVFTGASILITLPFLTSTFYYIPKATLASIIICAMFYLFDYQAFRVLWKNNKVDVIPFLTTLIASIFLSLEYGILLGIATHLIFILHRAARPNFKIEKLTSWSYNEVFLIAPTTKIQFPALEHLKSSLLKFDKSNSLIIFDGNCIDHMDVTVVKSISHLIIEIERKKQKLILLNFQKPIKDLCLRVDKKLQKYFKEGEDTIQDWPSSKLNEVFSVL